MVQKYIIDKADIQNLLTGKDIPLGQGSKARAFCVEIAGEMTNGELFQAIFPCEEVHVNGLQEGCVHFSMKSNLDTMDCFSLDWWNAPYKGVSE